MAEQLIQLDDFQMWVENSDPGVCRNLIKRANRLLTGEDPGPEREPAFTWIVRDEIKQICESWKYSDNERNKPYFYDLGANVGLFTLIIDQVAKQNAKDYFIFSVEPDEKNLVILKKNIRLNHPKAYPFDCAIGDFSNKGSFHLSDHTNLGALVPHQKTHAGVREVQVYTFEDFVRIMVAKPSFIKMDIEGGEVEFFKGAKEYLITECTAPCKILMELHPTLYSPDRQLEPELRFLFENGWTCKYMVSAAMLQPDKFKDAGLEPWKEFPTKGHSRAIYRNPFRADWNKLVLDFACHENYQEIPGKKPSRKIVRSILIEKKG